MYLTTKTVSIIYKQITVGKVIEKVYEVATSLNTYTHFKIKAAIRVVASPTKADTKYTGLATIVRKPSIMTIGMSGKSKMLEMRETEDIVPK